MSVQLVLGRPGTGKTTFCLQAMATRLRLGETLYFIVPEQFSLQAEKKLIQYTTANTGSNTALTQVQVLSFGRLAYHWFARMGGFLGKTVDEVGRHMLLRKIVYECAGQLRYYARSVDKQGFIDHLAQTMTELARYNVTMENLQVPGASDSLQMKLDDLTQIVTRYREKIAGQYLITDDILALLASRMDTADFFKGSHIWVDGFNGFTPQERRILAHLFKAAAQVTITLPLDENAADHFQATADTAKKLRALAQEAGVSMDKTLHLLANYRHAHAEPLRFFSERFTVSGYNPAVYPHKAAEITVVTAQDRYGEAHEAARRIQQLTHEKGWRYRDMAILCGDLKTYEKLLRNVFDQYDIPLFVDVKTDVISHPLTELIRAAIDIAAYDWTYESVFRFLKTALTPLSRDEVDLLENFVLARGIKSFYWKRPFVLKTAEPAEDTNDVEEAELDSEADSEPAFSVEESRLKLLEILSPFAQIDRPDKKENVGELGRRVFDLLYGLNVPATLESWFVERMEAGDHETARRHKQIWPKICEIFDKLVEILGDESVTLREFAKILEAGFTRADLGLIPPTVDQVIAGDAGRSRFPEIKALFVLGANDHLLPTPPKESGLFTDDERKRLTDAGLELAPGLERQAGDELFEWYRAFAMPEERLILSYSLGEPDGGALRPAKLLTRLRQMFPALTEAVAQSPAYPPVERAWPESGLPPQALSEGSVRKLYGSEFVTAVSRLEKFMECPFSYFVTYVLKAKERPVYQVRAMDMGILFHEVLALFSRQLAESGIGWRSLTKDMIAQRVSECVETVVPNADDSFSPVLRATARNRFVLRRVKRICETSVWALSEHIKRGTFQPVGVELAFTPDSPVTTLEVHLNNEKKMILTGRIDRVDIYRTDDGVFVKIIDYKSGSRRFDPEDVYAGTQLQLMLYMNALLKNGQILFGSENISLEALPGGVFYFNIDDPILPADNALDAEEREARLLRCFRMSGLALAELEAVTAMDENLSVPGSESAVIPVALKNDGAFSKNSAVADRDGFALLSQAADEKIKEIGLKMTEGIIEPHPYRKGRRSGCDYCRYGAVCRYSVSQ